MFTGIIQDIGTILARETRSGGDVRLEVRAGGLDLKRMRTGDSIAVAGVCLTVIELRPASFVADVSCETLSLTTLVDARVGARVNLEAALHLGDALGGHLVVGHVDGVADVLKVREDAHSRRVRVRVPHALSHYIARKGSVTLDGVSLTVNAVEGDEFEVNLVPHTLAVTTLAGLAAGERCNLEVDLIARYAERLLHAGSAS